MHIQFVFTYVGTYVCMHVCTYVHMYMHMHVCMNVHTNVRMHIMHLIINVQHIKLWYKELTTFKLLSHFSPVGIGNQLFNKHTKSQ